MFSKKSLEPVEIFKYIVPATKFAVQCKDPIDHCKYSPENPLLVNSTFQKIWINLSKSC